jgi:hypothetical protein
MGTSWVADQLWQHLGIADATRGCAEDRRVDGEVAERVLFSMVANRLSDRPLSKHAGCKWVAERVFIDGLVEVTDDACYRAMDLVFDELAELQRTVFFSVANLLNLQIDLLLFDTTSTYWETEAGDERLTPDDVLDGDDRDAEGDEANEAVEAAVRTWGASKDHRPDLPQVVIGMAVTGEGIPVRVWTFPGNTSDQVLIRTVTDDLRGWELNRSSGRWTAASPRRPTAPISSAPAAVTSWARSCALTAPKPTPPSHGRGATTRRPATCASRRCASTTGWPATASSSATTPRPPPATPRSAPRSLPASKRPSPAPTSSHPISAPSSPAV